MNRTEHLQWCKDRALEYLKEDEMPIHLMATNPRIKADIPQSIASFISDMGKHNETKNHIGLGLLPNMFGLPSVGEVKNWINGFN